MFHTHFSWVTGLVSPYLEFCEVIRNIYLSGAVMKLDKLNNFVFIVKKTGKKMDKVESVLYG